MPISAVFTQDPSLAATRMRALAAHQHRALTLPSVDHLPTLLAAVPVVSKEDLVAHGNEARDAILAQAILFSETSGTTSSPLQTPRSKQDLGWNILNQIMAYKQMLQPGLDRVAILHPSVLSPFVEASAMALQALGVGYVRLFPIPNICDYRRIREVLVRYDITTIMSTPTLVFKLFHEIMRDGGQFPSSLKKILVTGERVLPECARTLERLAGEGSLAQPFVYGASETASIMVGRRDCGYSPILEDFIFEIHEEEGPAGRGGKTTLVNPQFSEGEIRGALVVTWLREGLLPVLRYETGDLFTVTSQGAAHSSLAGNNYVFRFEGRQAAGGLDIATQQRIEAALYSLSQPIFHFDCRLRSEYLQLQVEVIVADASPGLEEEVRSSVGQAIGVSWEVKVMLNRTDHPFYNFSPSAKTQRFTYRG